MPFSKSIQEFLKLEAASGLVLFAAAILAMVLANSPLSPAYAAMLQTQASVSIGNFAIAKPILLWVNDGLMAIFFLLIGLEVKREILEGELSDRSKAALPVAAAIGGMIVPSAIYVWLNRHDPSALNGWAIPAATDIAFALGVLALLGKRVPESLKVFLLALAIIDDLAAIGIIAVFYSGDLSLGALGLAAITLALMVVMNRAGVSRPAPYLIAGLLLWVFVLKSGVHATLAGVATAFAIPLRARNDESPSPLNSVEHALHPWVVYGIMPSFAFANAGLSLGNINANALFQSVPLGIMLGMVIGKPVGITLSSWVAIRSRLAGMPEGASWMQLIGVGMLCGIGFTMSLFVASLAFERGATEYFLSDRLGILAGTVLAGALGYGTLRLAIRRTQS
jgi:NhaA family Na+:H+ antiporter